MDDLRAFARFPEPAVRCAAGWQRCPRSLAGDSGFERLTHRLWVRLPTGAPLRTWERAALIQRHHVGGQDLLVSHLSAAQLWGLPVSETPMPWSHALLDEPVRHRRLETRPELSYLRPRHHFGNERFLLHKGLGLLPALGPWDCRVTQPVETLLHCTPWLPGWRLVAAVDHLRVMGPHLTGAARPMSREELLQTLSQLPAGTRGIRRLRVAIGRSAAPTWSPMETLLRLALVSKGVPPPAMNLPVTAPGGRHFHLDLAWEGARVAAEYNGRVHYENRRVYGDEQYRLQRLEEMGWRVRVVVVEDLRDHARFQQLVTWLNRALT